MRMRLRTTSAGSFQRAAIPIRGIEFFERRKVRFRCLQGDSPPGTASRSIHWGLPADTQSRVQAIRFQGYKNEPGNWLPLWRRGKNSLTTGPLLTGSGRSEEHTSELQSRGHIVCRLLLETNQ